MICFKKAGSPDAAGAGPALGRVRPWLRAAFVRASDVGGDHQTPPPVAAGAGQISWLSLLQPGPGAGVDHDLGVAPTRPTDASADLVVADQGIPGSAGGPEGGDGGVLGVLDGEAAGH